MTDKNKGFFERLVDSSFEVKCGELGVVHCRELPMPTLAYLITRLGTRISERVEDASVAISVALAKITEFEDKTSVPAITTAFTSLLPMFHGIVAESPELLQRLIMDVVIDMSEDEYDVLPVSVTLKILDESLKRLDEEDVADRLAAVFTSATSIYGNAQNKTREMHEQDSVQEKEPKSSGAKEAEQKS